MFRTLFIKESVNYKRNRLELNDGDFIDLDFSSVNSSTLVLAIHGLEGSSNSKYILSLAKRTNLDSKDFVAVNLRGCSGEHNRLYSAYHSGKTEDLHYIIEYIESNYKYDEIILVGYSLGGNLTLKYLGEQGNNISTKIMCAIAISAPVDLTGSSRVLAERQNKLYIYSFLKTLKKKTLYKIEKFPESNLNKKEVLAATSFLEYDNLYTAPANGFKNAQDYWVKNSSKPFINSIQIPTLILNSLDDTFLSKECYPIDSVKNHPYVSLETPKYGGHVGFNSSFSNKKGFWLEKRILEFIKIHNPDFQTN